MGKTQYDSDNLTKNRNEPCQKKKKSGRPSNVQIQTTFMNVLRQTKLQAINAETELELEIAFFTNDDDKKSRRKEESTSLEKLEKIFEFNSLTSEEKKILNEKFDKHKNQWKFDEIQEQSDIPDLFFDDENNLAFILHQIISSKAETSKNIVPTPLTQRKQNKLQKITAQQLFFLCLLCFNAQQNLRDVVLEFLLKNETLIVNLLKSSIEKAKLKQSQKMKKNKENENLLNQLQIPRVRKQSQAPCQESIFEASQLTKIKGQTKKIQKPLKKHNQSHMADSQQSQEPILTQKQKQQKLILCFINYISWCYFQIFSFQQELLRKIKKDDSLKLSQIEKPF